MGSDASTATLTELADPPYVYDIAFFSRTDGNDRKVQETSLKNTALINQEVVIHPTSTACIYADDKYDHIYFQQNGTSELIELAETAQLNITKIISHPCTDRVFWLTKDNKLHETNLEAFLAHNSDNTQKQWPLMTPFPPYAYDENWDVLTSKYRIIDCKWTERGDSHEEYILCSQSRWCWQTIVGYFGRTHDLHDVVLQLIAQYYFDRNMVFRRANGRVSLVALNEYDEDLDIVQIECTEQAVYCLGADGVLWRASGCYGLDQVEYFVINHIGIQQIKCNGPDCIVLGADNLMYGWNDDQPDKIKRLNEKYKVQEIDCGNHVYAATTLKHHKHWVWNCYEPECMVIEKVLRTAGKRSDVQSVCLCKGHIKVIAK